MKQAQGKAFNTWRDNAQELAGTRAKLQRCLNRIIMSKIAKCFSSWVFVAQKTALYKSVIGKCLGRIRNQALSVAFAGRDFILSGDESGTLAVWSIVSGGCVQRQQARASGPSSHRRCSKTRCKAVHAGAASPVAGE